MYVNYGAHFFISFPNFFSFHILFSLIQYFVTISMLLLKTTRTDETYNFIHQTYIYTPVYQNALNKNKIWVVESIWEDYKEEYRPRRNRKSLKKDMQKDNLRSH